MIIAIHQPNFLPWIGYFFKIKNSDTFVFLDNVQYVKGSVANRNYIKNKKGEPQLITVPVRLSKGWDKKYNEIEIDYSFPWNRKMLNIIKDSYIKAKFFDLIFPELEDILLKKNFKNLSELNIELIKYIIDFNEIKTKTFISSELSKDFGSKNMQNLGICKHFNADTYLSGSGAKKYNDENLFEENNVKIKYVEFNHPVYHQLWDSFIPNLSIIDLMFNCGKDSKNCF